LVVIAIIATLTGLLLPAVQAAREAARRNTCINNSKQISLALMNYESGHNYFPGYLNRMGSGSFTQPVSWVVTLLPFLDRKDLYDNWADAIQGGWPTASAMSAPNSPTYGLPFTRFGAVVSLPVLQCPSDLADNRDGPALSYVVNRGRNGWNTNRSVGVCFNAALYNPSLAVSSSNLKPTYVSLDYLGAHDGAATTLLLSETLQTPTSFQTTFDASTGAMTFRVPTDSAGLRQPLLYLQQTTGAETPSLSPPSYPLPTVSSGCPGPYYYRPYPEWTSTTPKAVSNNIDKSEMDLGFEWGSLCNSGATTLSAVSTRSGARVSDQIGSRHGGIFVSAFCDGHVSTLHEGINLDVFRHLMTPNDSGYLGTLSGGTAGPPPTPGSPPGDSNFATSVLDEASF
jgi:type II secretory pathway pseudopilin PulG